VLRRVLLAVSASKRIRQLLVGAPVSRDVVARFVAGDSADDALRVTEALQADRLLVSLDYLGEDTVDPEQATAWRRSIRLLRGSAQPRPGRPAPRQCPSKATAGRARPGRRPRRRRPGEHQDLRRPARRGGTITLDAGRPHRGRRDVAHRGAGPRVPGPGLCDPVLRAQRGTAGRWLSQGQGRALQGAYSAQGIFPTRAESTALRTLYAGAAGRSEGYDVRDARPRLVGIAMLRVAAKKPPASFECRCCTASGPRSSCGWRVAGRGSGSTCLRRPWYGYLKSGGWPGTASQPRLLLRSSHARTAGRDPGWGWGRARLTGSGAARGDRLGLGPRAADAGAGAHRLTGGWGAAAGAELGPRAAGLRAGGGHDRPR
jgi:hypothetical protein